ncbi:unnamed protein product, partial [Ectocarpus sp. 8 AP-2014]
RALRRPQVRQGGGVSVDRGGLHASREGGAPGDPQVVPQERLQLGVRDVQGCRGRGKPRDALFPVRGGLPLGPPDLRRGREELGPRDPQVAAAQGLPVGLAGAGRRGGGRGDGRIRVGNEQQVPFLRERCADPLR